MHLSTALISYILLSSAVHISLAAPIISEEDAPFLEHGLLPKIPKAYHGVIGEPIGDGVPELNIPSTVADDDVDIQSRDPKFNPLEVLPGVGPVIDGVDAVEAVFHGAQSIKSEVQGAAADADDDDSADNTQAQRRRGDTNELFAREPRLRHKISTAGKVVSGVADVASIAQDIASLAGAGHDGAADEEKTTNTTQAAPSRRDMGGITERQPKFKVHKVVSKVPVGVVVSAAGLGVEAVGSDTTSDSEAAESAQDSADDIMGQSRRGMQRRSRRAMLKTSSGAREINKLD